MNPVAEEILMHYGIKYRSGRYPWGSGKEPFQRSGDFLSRYEQLLNNEKLKEKDIADGLGLTIKEMRVQLAAANHERWNLQADRARSLRADGKSLNEITQIMGFNNDSSVRSLLNENTAFNKNAAKRTAEILKEELKLKGMIDVGIGAERQLGVSKNTLEEALFLLSTEDYKIYQIGVPQITRFGKQSNTQILCNPDIEHSYVYNNTGDIKVVGEFHSSDGGLEWAKREYPSSLESSRIKIRYGDEGGSDKDGVIELRPGVQDIDLGKSHYAQVRILVDGTHYLKGMAMYSNEIPDGADVVFNTNKKSNVSKMDTMKPIKNDPDDPFGAYIKAEGQSWYDTPDGTKKLSVINKLNEEGDWDSMSRTLSSQFLSKQPIKLIEKQLKLTYDDKVSEFDDIMALTLPTLKKKLLNDFADDCDGAVVHLKAAALPRQSVQVILPVTEMKDNEIYAPNYENGEKVALIRYPHGGTFEIPVLTVNNKNKSAREILGENIKDAVGINPEVAKRLSGADFDGDTVTVIPVNSRVSVKSTPPLRDLKGFDAKDQYSIPEGNPNKVKLMTKQGTENEMGNISNLITDMTLKGAKESEIARAVKHSMVVVDAYKHELNYKQSEKDNGIKELKKLYQAHADGNGYGGASTLISRKKQDIRVLERKGSGIVDPDTGEKTYRLSGRKYRQYRWVDDPQTGKRVKEYFGPEIEAKDTVKLVSTVKDMNELSSGWPQEKAYADYGNKMKALGNQARKTALKIGRIEYSSTAKQTYLQEVDHLLSQLNVALTNSPLERVANAIANSVVKAKKQAYPELENDKKALGKIKDKALYDARNYTGAHRRTISINDREWEAILSGALSDTQIESILRFADPKEVRQRAMPRQMQTLSQAKINKIKSMMVSGYTNEQIADALNVSTSTVFNYLSD